jgi:hypothetical protein
VSVTRFSPDTSDQGADLQNALARLGAAHLREIPGIVPSEPGSSY